MNDANYRRAILRITTGDREKLESLIFSRYPYREWGTFFRFGYRITSWGMLVTYVAPMPPGPGELNRGSSIVEFDPRYILRAQLGLPGNPLGIGVIHSHPQGCGTFASSLDNDMDGYFSREFALYGSGRPYISLRMAKTEAGSFAFSGEAWVNGECMPFTELLTTGPVLYRERAEVCRPANLDLANTDPKSNARARELLGDDKVNRIQAAVVAIVGCSGTGSPAAHVLARAGVGYFVLVDPQPFERSNHERFHASTWADLSEHQPKVELIRRLILSINPSAKVTSIRGNVLDEAVLDELLKCDLVLGCTDTQHSRAALSDYATLYLLPCIDSAVLMRAKDGRITEQVGEFARYSSDEPCAWCLGRINQNALSYELMPEQERKARQAAAAEATGRGLDGQQYWGGEPPKELTVGYMTSTVGAMQAGYAHCWLTGSAQMPHQRFQFDLGMPLLGVVPVEKQRRPECCCHRTKGYSDQGRADRSITRPDHWLERVTAPSA